MGTNVYAVVENGVVVNMVVWDGVAQWQPPEGSQAIPVPEGTFVDIGWLYSNGAFSAPERGS